MQDFDALLADLDLSLEELLAGSCEVTNEKPPRLSDFTSSACNVISGYLNHLVSNGDDGDDGGAAAVFSRRFFVQFAGRLYMFSAADPSSIPLDVFNLQHPACVKLKPTPGIAHAFEVVGLTSSGQIKSWILAANNRPLRKIWIEAISSKFKSGNALMTEILELQQELELSKDGFNLIGQRDQSSIAISTTCSPVPELYLKSSMGSMSPSSITDSPTSSYHSSPSEHGSHTFKSSATTPLYSFLQDPAPVTSSSSLRYSQSLRASTQQPQERRRRSTVRSTAIVHPQQQQQQEYDLDFEYQTIKSQHWPKHDTNESIVSRESSWTVNLKRAGSRKNGKSISDNLSSAGLM
ncbi:hypothetical protein BJ741DRAFT_644762 [Chytriomyces cf. hyalinus JEL632]|nr:hypothetical protein BJ741DRAFT_644762 [Chytriomyces cf. hyalinus JEL632]